jgi:upstream activation factor subunit UAF30
MQLEEQLDTSLFEQFEEIVNGLTLVKNQIGNLQQNMKQLEKNIKKQMKGLKKEANKNKSKGNRAPSGFAKPSKVTKELCDFMNKNEGTEIARTEVTKALVSYIKENKLENETNSKIINPDTKLKFLLGLEEGQELTYFTIQKYMNKHFNQNQPLEKVSDKQEPNI